MDNNINSLDGTNINDFITNYRNALQQNYEANVANIENQKKLDETSIMSQANTRGSLYSNFPQRQKLQYQTKTYLPNLVSARNTYQTGIDTLRSKATDLSNNIITLEQAIADLNKYGTSVYYPN